MDGNMESREWRLIEVKDNNIRLLCSVTIW